MRFQSGNDLLRLPTALVVSVNWWKSGHRVSIRRGDYAAAFTAPIS
jgi:hypothetical protein